MTCADCREALDALIDGELTADEENAARAHITSCEDCSRRLAEREAVRRQIKSLPKHSAPDLLRARVRELSKGSAAIVERPRRRLSLVERITAIAAAALLVAGIGTVAIRASRGSVADDVLASHLRSLVPGHLMDVQSTDQHNVKPWFNGRVNLSPSVPNLDSAGYPLLGGRVDYVGGRQAAVVVYGRRKHVINVFSWPQSGDDLAAAAQTKNGFNLLHLRREGIDEWIVSDLNLKELEDFSRRYVGSL